ncbi:hypothetical protein [Deinococcus sp.]
MTKTVRNIQNAALTLAHRVRLPPRLPNPLNCGPMPMTFNWPWQAA